MTVQTLVACNGRKFFEPCKAFLPLPTHHSEAAARYEALRAGWSRFGENDYCPTCSYEQAAYAAGGDSSAGTG